MSPIVPIIVDTATDPTAARAFVDAFGTRLRRPVRAIVYTHSHPDHTGGARVFAGDDAPAIYAHELFVKATPDAGRAGREGGDQFGMSLPAAQFINAGVQAEFGRVVPPTPTFGGEELSVTIAGVRVQLLHTPGETPDTIAVWLPDARVLMPGDNVFRGFPNVAPIRGSRLRSPDAWLTSLDRVIALAPEHVVPSHTRPVLGVAAAAATLTAYRDGVKSIVDQTVAGIRKGERPDELVAHESHGPDRAGRAPGERDRAELLPDHGAVPAVRPSAPRALTGATRGASGLSREGAVEEGDGRFHGGAVPLLKIAAVRSAGMRGPGPVLVTEVGMTQPGPHGSRDHVWQSVDEPLVLRHRVLSAGCHGVDARTNPGGRNAGRAEERRAVGVAQRRVEANEGHHARVAGGPDDRGDAAEAPGHDPDARGVDAARVLEPRHRQRREVCGVFGRSHVDAAIDRLWRRDDLRNDVALARERLGDAQEFAATAVERPQDEHEAMPSTLRPPTRTRAQLQVPQSRGRRIRSGARPKVRKTLDQVFRVAGTDNLCERPERQRRTRAGDGAPHTEASGAARQCDHVEADRMRAHREPGRVRATQFGGLGCGLARRVHQAWSRTGQCCKDRERVTHASTLSRQ